MKTLILLAALMVVSAPAYAEQKDEQRYRNALRGFYNCARLEKIAAQNASSGISGIKFTKEENRFGERLQHAVPSLTAWYAVHCRKVAK